MGRIPGAVVCDLLEPRQLLSIVWENEAIDTTFQQAFGPAAEYARAIVHRAIADWNAAIPSFNYATNATNGNLLVTLTAADLPVGHGGFTRILTVEDGTKKPTSAEIVMDSDGFGFQWFYDTTPNDDREFNSIVAPNVADAIGQFGSDFYTTVLHELGHAVGIANLPELKISEFLRETAFADPLDDSAKLLVLSYSGQTDAILTSAEGGHLFESRIPERPNWPSHPFDIMNSGRTEPLLVEFADKFQDGDPIRVFPGSLAAPRRGLISQTDLDILAGVYGYEVVARPTVNNGVLTATGTAGNDRLRFSLENGIYTVKLNGTNVAHIGQSDVSSLLAYGRAGDDRIIINDNITVPAVVFAGAGNDYVRAGGGQTTLRGGLGVDTLVEGSTSCVLRGGAEIDNLIRRPEPQSGSGAIMAGIGYD